MATATVDPVGSKSPKATADLAKPKRISGEVDIKKLLESGAHFGHQTSRWHPKMSPYIHSKRDGAHIIDLTKTVDALNEALEFLTKTASAGKQILVVGTKRQAKDIVHKLADDTGMPYVTERWVGGMLTNQKTIGGRIKYLKDLETKLESGQLASKYNKLEVQRFEEEIERMNIMYGGIKDMAARVGAVFIVDIIHEANAVREARKLGIKTVAIVDTNADPSLIDYPIPANDDAIKTIQLITDYVGQAITAGKAKSKVTSDSKKATEETKATIKTPNLEPETPEPEEVKGNG
ncbi:MAG TPA: 30S ribosomal protein S2 [Candidatus Saccharimonadales bacterium]|nr:30S ribosomal protein S2 [Candidatus Saccharimonadales bacterium]